MAALLTIICFVFLVLESLIGMVANGSIVLINFIDWFRRRKLSPADLILICLGLSRLLEHVVIILDVTLFTLLNHIPSNNLLMLIRAWMFTNAVNIWFAACLSVFYLAKIAIFSHPIFLQVRQRLSGLVPCLLLGSVVLSASLTTIATTSWNYGLSACNPYKSLSSNRSNAGMNFPNGCMLILALIAVFDFTPFIIFLSSSIFLISSLWKHVRRVQHSGNGTRDLNTQAHWSAIKALASFAVLYLVSVAAVTLRSVLIWNNQHTWTTLLYNVSALYPTGHAIILILVNPKLKQEWVRNLQNLKRASRCTISGNFKPVSEKSGGEKKIWGKFWRNSGENPQTN